MDLNDRQQKVIKIFRMERRVTNTKYQEITGVSRATAKRDLEGLVRKGLLILGIRVLPKAGVTGRGTYYVLAGKLDTMRTNKT